MDAWKGSQMSSCGQWCHRGASRMRASGLPGRGLPPSSQGTELCADTVKARNICTGSHGTVLRWTFQVFSSTVHRRLAKTPRSRYCTRQDDR